MVVMDYETEATRHFSRTLMCPTSGISYPDPEPNLFSFNSPYGACKKCSGLGEVVEVDIDKIIPDDSLSIKKGGFAPLGEYKRTWIFDKIEKFLMSQGLSLTTPIKDFEEDVVQALLYGDFTIEKKKGQENINFEGVVHFLSRHADESSKGIQRWAQSFTNKVSCPECKGARVKKEALHFKLNEKNIGDLANMDLLDLNNFFNELSTNIK